LGVLTVALVEAQALCSVHPGLLCAAPPVVILAAAMRVAQQRPEGRSAVPPAMVAQFQQLSTAWLPALQEDAQRCMLQEEQLQLLSKAVDECHLAPCNVAQKTPGQSAREPWL